MRRCSAGGGALSAAAGSPPGVRLLCAGAGRAGGAARGLRWVATIAALAFGSAILGAAPAPAPIRIETSGPMWGALVRLVLYADTAADGEAAAVSA